MSKLLLTSLTALCYIGTHAQVTNSFPNDGNVGIGTTGPLTKLHIFKSSSGNTPHSLSDLSIEDNDHVMLSLMTYNNRNAYYAFADTDDTFVGGIQYDHPVDKMHFRVNNHASDMVITANGNVGIGTTSPSSELEIKSSQSDNAELHINSRIDGGVSIIRFQDNDNSTWGFLSNYPSAGKFSLYNYQSTSNALVMDSNGNLGIGTAYPGTYKLAVNGSIRAKEIKVETGWADYVFREEYDLPTLEEVEKHIKEKGHLINIPSAKEVEEHGVHLGEMNKLLLEKIEELTLYTLQQQEEIDQYRENMLQLAQKLEVMEQRLDNLKN